ncbi:peptide ABC transporter permease [Leptolyngbya sp. 'hensonii']|nr:peptide ABC transporter permease [Leptolyngbya sp. 'hensonii']
MQLSSATLQTSDLALALQGAILNLAQATPDRAGDRQSTPNQDRFPQPVPAPGPLPAEPQQPLTPLPPVEPTSPPPATAQPIAVRKIEVIGSSVFSSTDFSTITRTYEGRSATLEELREAADKITQLYLDRGFITSRAILVDQTIVDGVVQIRVIEGGLERIDVEGTQRVNPDYIRARIELAGLKPVNKDRLEDQLRLLRADPQFDNVEASLRAGTQFGQSILTIRVKEANPFNAIVSIDNYSPPSVGSERFGIGASYRNVLTSNGDQLAASYSRTTAGGANLYDFSYRLTVNPMNGTLQVRYAPSDYKVIDPVFALLKIRGGSDLYEISFRQPLIRTPREELALSLGIARQTGQTFLGFTGNDIGFGFGSGPEANGTTRTTVLKFGQDYVSRDVQGAWAFRSQFSLGVDLFGVTINAAPTPDGLFFSWLGQAQRVQVLNPDQVLIFQADLQLSSDTLLAAQQFVMGGGQSVRGYRQNARSGDNGFRFSVEDRIVVLRDESGAALLQAVPFLDVGYVWNVTGNPNLLPSQNLLAGGGVGLIWAPFPGLGIRLDYARPFVNLNDRGNNIQEEAFYFSVNYQL